MAFQSTEEVREFQSLLDEVQQKLENISSEQGQMFGDIFSSAKEQLQIISTDIRRNGIAEFHYDELQTIQNVYTAILENVNAIGQSSFDTLELERQMNQLLTERGGIYEILGHILDTQISKQQKIQTITQQTIADMESVVDKLSKSLQKLPGYDYLDKLFKFDEIGDNIKSNLTDEIIAFAQAGNFSAASFGTAMRGAMGTIIGSIGLMTIAITGFVALIGVAIARFVEVDQITRSIRENTGLFGDELAQTVDIAEQLNVNFARYGISLENAAEITTSLLDRFGSLAFVTRENAEAVAGLTTVLGMSADEATGLLQLYSNIAGTTGQTASNLIAQTVALAEANDVAPKAVLQDIANSSGRIFEFTNGLPDNLANTAVMARRLGLSLDNVASIAENLLNFESSIESQMNAAVLTGRQLNLEQARYFAFLGETSNMMDAIVEQVGSWDELQSMLPHQQKALAEAIGISAGELRNMVRTQDELNELGKGTLSTFEALQRGVSLEEILDKEGVLTPLQQITNAFKSLAISISTIFLPVLDVLAPALIGVAEVFSWIAEGISLISPLLKVLVGIVGTAITAFGALWLVASPIGWVTATIAAIGVVYKYWDDIVDFVGDSVNLIIDKFMSFKDVLLKVFMATNPLGWLIGIGTAIYRHWDGIVEFFKNAGSVILDAITLPFEMAWELLFGNTIWSVDTIMGVFGPISDVIVSVFETMSNLVITIFERVFDFISQPFELISSIVDKVFDIEPQVQPEIQQNIESQGVVEAINNQPAPQVNIEKESDEVDLAAVVDKLDELIVFLKKGQGIYIDGRKAGIAISLAQPKFG